MLKIATFLSLILQFHLGRSQSKKMTGTFISAPKKAYFIPKKVTGGKAFDCLVNFLENDTLFALPITGYRIKAIANSGDSILISYIYNEKDSVEFNQNLYFARGTLEIENFNNIMSKSGLQEEVIKIKRKTISIKSVFVGEPISEHFYIKKVRKKKSKNKRQ